MMQRVTTRGSVSGGVAEQRRGLRMVSLVAAIYFMVSGGPYGLEDLIQSAGYRMAIVLLAVTPIFWSLPVAMLVGELAAALPEDGGYYAWVRRALGPFWGFQEAWLSLVASIFDMAIYPTIFVLYLGQIAPAWGQGARGFAVGAAVVVVCAAWNIGGARAVGEGSVWLMVALLAPFAVLIVIALTHAGPEAPLHHGSEGIVAGLLVCMWNYMGWDNASTVAREVENPQRTYPRAMIAAVIAVTVSYILPVAAVMRTGLDPSSWTTGAWVTAGRALGGAVLGWAIVAGGLLCGLGMMNALVLSYSRVPMAMAEDGLLPRVLARRHARTGAPWVSVVVCAAAWMAALTLGFDRLVELDVLLYGGSLLLEFVALAVLRVKEPELARPFRVPGGLAGVVLCTAGPVAVLALAGVQGADERAGPISALMLGVLLAAAGVVVYWITPRARATDSQPAG